jgi:hypothetical protein
MIIQQAPGFDILGGMLPRLLSISVVFAVSSFALPETVQILDKDGKATEGLTALAGFTVNVNGSARKIVLADVLSVHNGEPASPGETARIQAGLAAIQAYKAEGVQSEARRNRDAATEDLASIGLPVVTPLLRALKDTDQHEPRALYRLFERLLPSEADQPDREASLIRLASGELIRGKIGSFPFEIGGKKLEWSNTRRLAVRRRTVARHVELHSLRHSTQIEYLDAAVIVTAASLVNVKAKGFVRLSFDIDGWASDGNGLKVPGPNYKTNLVDGFPFGAIVGRVNAAGAVTLIGADFSRKGLPPGRLYLAVNDNPHWQNNVGAFRVSLQATDAYDVGDAR